jgi:hypothetical protein
VDDRALTDDPGRGEKEHRVACGRRLPREWLVRSMVSLVGILLLVAPVVPVSAQRAGPIRPDTIVAEQGHAYWVDLQRYNVRTPSEPETVSQLVVLEDGRPLPRPHQLHSAIRELGAGRFSHWRSGLYFSALDNSDPRQNGRAYTIEAPRSVLSIVPGIPTSPRFGIAIGAAGLLLLIAPWAPATVLASSERRQWIRLHTVPFLAASAVPVLVTWGLSRNALDVTRPTSRWAHAVALAILVLVSIAYPLTRWFAERRHGLQRRLAVTARVFDRVGEVAWGVAVVLLAFECMARVVPLIDSFAINPGSRFLWPAWHDPRNTLGFNDREYGPKTGPRVMLLGDSYTEGTGVAKHERFSALLEGLLRTTDSTVEVVNTGGSGLDTFEEASILLRIGDVIQPDVVIVAYVLNDADGADPASRRPLAVGDNFFIHTLGSYAYYRFYTMVRGPWAGRSRDAVWPMWQARHEAASPGWWRVLDGLDRIAAWCEERGALRYLVVYPVFASGTERMRDVMDQVIGAGTARGFVSRSALDDFLEPWEALAFSRYDWHPGARAHVIMARGLHALIGEPRVSYRRRAQAEPARDPAPALRRAR